MQQYSEIETEVDSEENNRDIVLLNPSKEFSEEIIYKYDDKNNVKEYITICATEEVIKEIKGDFKLSSRSVNLIESGNMTIKSLDSNITGCLVKIVDKIYVVLDSDSEFSFLNIEDEQEIQENINAIVHQSKSIPFENPSLNEIYTTLTNQLGEDVAQDYKYIIENVNSFEHHQNDFDEVSAIVLTAAHHGILLYHVGEWAESCNFASKATISQKKVQLEEYGYLESEKVDTFGRGRPRLKLNLSQNMYEEHYDVEIIKQLQELII